MTALIAAHTIGCDLTEITVAPPSPMVSGTRSSILSAGREVLIDRLAAVGAVRRRVWWRSPAWEGCTKGRPARLRNRSFGL
jgi:hypothetical protein